MLKGTRFLITVALGAILIVVFGISSRAAAGDEAEAYLNKVEQRIMTVWKLPPKSDELKVTLRYHLSRTGSVSSVRVEGSSAIRALTSRLCRL